MKRRALASLVLVAAALACGSGGNTTPGSFTVDFPTVAAGVAVIKSTTGVEVQAFATNATGAADSGTGGACDALIEASLTGSMMPKPVAMTSSPVTPCDLLAGKGSVPVPYGNYAFLAVAASAKGQPLLIGCAEQTISSTNTAVVIPLTLVSTTTAIPATKCTSLSQACPSGGDC